MNKQNYKLTLLENAIDYLNESLKYYRKAERDLFNRNKNLDRLYKFALLHAVSFAECFLKHYISLESEILIYKNCNKKNITDNTTTIGLDEIFVTLENLGQQSTLKQVSIIKNEIAKLQKIRNQCMHYIVSYEPETVRDNIGSLLHKIVKFDEANKNIGVLEKIDEQSTYNNIWSVYKENREKTLQEIQKLKAQPPQHIKYIFDDEIECPACSNATMYICIEEKQSEYNHKSFTLTEQNGYCTFFNCKHKCRIEKCYGCCEYFAEYDLNEDENDDTILYCNLCEK